jgi:hypothetical protein
VPPTQGHADEQAFAEHHCCHNQYVDNGEALTVDEIPGPRWELALERLRDGGPTVILPGDVTVGLQRWIEVPAADGKLHVYIWSETEPSALTAAMVESDVQGGLATLSRAMIADPRLVALMSSLDVSYDYLYDYGMGAVQVAALDADGSVAML